MKPLLPTSSGKDIQGVILDDGSSVFFRLWVCSRSLKWLLCQYCSVRSDTDYTDHPSIKAISNRRFSSEFNYSPVSTSHIRNILDHLNPRKAVGVDGTSPRILRLGSPVLTEEVTKLINFCILNRSLQPEWKHARLTPFFKRGIDSDKTNYRYRRCLIKLFTTKLGMHFITFCPQTYLNLWKSIVAALHC